MDGLTGKAERYMLGVVVGVTSIIVADREISYMSLVWQPVYPTQRIDRQYHWLSY